jgi:hypothetical protein
MAHLILHGPANIGKSKRVNSNKKNTVAYLFGASPFGSKAGTLLQPSSGISSFLSLNHQREGYFFVFFRFRALMSEATIYDFYSSTTAGTNEAITGAFIHQLSPNVLQQKELHLQLSHSVQVPRCSKTMQTSTP